MLNLLNRENRYAIRKEYMLRVFNSFLIATIFLAFSFLIVKISLFSFIDLEHKNIEQKKIQVENALLSSEQTEFNNKISHLEKEYELFKTFKNKPSEYLSLILDNRIDGISINEIQVDLLEAGVEIKVGGLASNRNVLLAFSEKLKNHERFENVNIPFSSFVKDVEVPFVINIKIIPESNE